MAEEKPAAPAAAPQEDKPAAPETRTYSQEEVDRITDKVRRNARRDTELKFRRDLQSAPQEPRGEAPKQDEEEKEPVRGEAETYEDHQKRLAEYHGRKAAREERKKERDEEEKKTRAEAEKKAEQTWHSKIAAAEKKIPGYADFLEDNEDLVRVIGQSPMRPFITESDIGPEIVHELIKLGEEEVKRIAALPKYKQAAAIDRIEEKLLAAAKPAPKEGENENDEDNPEDADGEAKKAEERERNDDGTFKSEKKDAPKKAPAPIEPVGTKGSASTSSKPSDKDDPVTWRRKRVAEIEAKKRGNLKPG